MELFLFPFFSSGKANFALCDNRAAVWFRFWMGWFLFGFVSSTDGTPAGSSASLALYYILYYDTRIVIISIIILACLGGTRCFRPCCPALSILLFPTYSLRQVVPR